MTVDRRRGLLITIAGMALISTDSLMVRIADVDEFDIVFWVGVFTALATLAVAYARGGPLPFAAVREGGASIVVAGALQALTTILFVLAVQSTSIANVMAITAASPLMAALFSWLLLRERATRWVWQAIALSAAGIAVVISGSRGGGHVSGDLYATAAIASYGLLVSVFRRHPRTDRLAAITIGGLVMAACAAWPATGEGYDAATWLALVAMGALIGPLARVLLALAPRFLPATEVALFAPVEALLATLWAFLAFGESPGSRTWLGGAVILGAVAWGVWPRPIPSHARLSV